MTKNDGYSIIQLTNVKKKPSLTFQMMDARPTSWMPLSN